MKTLMVVFYVNEKVNLKEMMLLKKIQVLAILVVMPLCAQNYPHKKILIPNSMIL